jgi:DNA-binding response OmpR family regulator
LLARVRALLRREVRGSGAVLTAGELWDENIDPFTHTVRVTIGTLRRKLGGDRLIETVVGKGYRLT